MTDIRRAFLSGTIAILFAVPFSGCGPSGPAMGRVNGIVTYDDKPLAAAEVMFVPVDGGRPARSLTDSQGGYVLTTFTKNDGAIVGEHLIVVAKGDAASSSDHASDDIPASPPIPGMPQATPLPASQIPERYGRTESSGLKATIHRGDNTIDLDLRR